MKLSFCTDSLAHLSYTEMLDYLCAIGVNGVEMTTGGWSSAPHVDMGALIGSSDKRRRFLAELDCRGMQIAALNCSGNPLDPGPMGVDHNQAAQDTMELAGLLGVKKIVMMSGLPSGSPDDKIPNWITYTVSWPESLQEVVRYQWEDVAIPFWQELVQRAKDNGVQKIALENFSAQLVWNPETLFRLRNAVDPIIGMNLDPSHLIWMGADPIAAARNLGDAIHHVHGKDVRLERGLVEVNGLLETKVVDDVANRTWNYVAVGCGQDLQWWKEFFSVVKMTGYDDFVSLEMEDLTMSVEAGISTSIHSLKHCISQ